jgi:hypothetical protein
MYIKMCVSKKFPLRERIWSSPASPTDAKLTRSGYADPLIDGSHRNLSGFDRQYVFRAG